MQVGHNEALQLSATRSLRSIRTCPASATLTEQLRPGNWAQEIVVGADLPNLYRVNANLYRSAQPTRAGFRFLDSRPSLARGDRPVRTVLSLRTFSGDRHLLSPASSLRLEQIRFDVQFPDDQDVVRFLRMVSSPQLQPVLVHCQRGADRTGAMMAIYRMVVDNWTAAQAQREMSNGDYDFDPLCQNLVHYVRGTDVAALKTQVARLREWQ